MLNSSSIFNPLITLKFPFSDVTGNENIRFAGTPYNDPSVKTPADYHSLLPSAQSLI